MKHFLSFCLGILFLASCNNSTDNSKQTEDKATAIKDNTSTKADSTPVLLASPSDLTTEEMKDDSVFADGSQPTSWANAGIDDPIAFKKFLKHLQIWVANNQKDSVVDAINFPLRNPKVKTKEDFLKKYDVYINNKVKTALKEINFRQIFRRDQGAMIGNGEIWLGQVKNGYAVKAINN